jgi:hypothetical protein
MTQQLNRRVKPMDERSKFDIARSNEVARKAFERNLRENPAPAPAKVNEAPRSRGGVLMTPDVVAARDNYIAAKLEAKDAAGRTARFTGIAADEATVAALFESWTRSHPALLVTRHNLISFGNAVTTYVYGCGQISIPILDDIFQYLLKEGYLETSRGSRARGAGGIMVSDGVRMYPALVTTEDKQEAAVQAVEQAAGNRAAEDKANRELSLSELAKLARASYKPNPRNIRVL